MLSSRTRQRLLDIIKDAGSIDPDDAAKMEPALPVAQMRALGNRLRHEYRDIDRRVIFDIARYEVPAVRPAAQLALEE